MRKISLILIFSIAWKVIAGSLQDKNVQDDPSSGASLPSIPTVTVTATRTVHPNDVILTITLTRETWTSTDVRRTVLPCTSVIDYLPLDSYTYTYSLCATSIMLNTFLFPLTATYTSYSTVWHTHTTPFINSYQDCSVTAVILSSSAGCSTSTNVITSWSYYTRSTLKRLCSWATTYNTWSSTSYQRPSVTFSIPQPSGTNTIFTFMQPYTEVKYVAITTTSNATTTFTTTECINPTVTVIETFTVTISVWPGTTTLWTTYHCELAGTASRPPGECNNILGPWPPWIGTLPWPPSFVSPSSQVNAPATTTESHQVQKMSLKVESAAFMNTAASSPTSTAQETTMQTWYHTSYVYGPTVTVSVSTPWRVSTSGCGPIQTPQAM